jgi:hypothetical protein
MAVIPRLDEGDLGEAAPLDALQEREFRLFFTGQFVSLVGVPGIGCTLQSGTSHLLLAFGDAHR